MCFLQNRHEMQHFVNNLERYTVNQIIHVSWEEFQQDLKQQVSIRTNYSWWLIKINKYVDANFLGILEITRF